MLCLRKQSWDFGLRGSGFKGGSGAGMVLEIHRDVLGALEPYRKWREVGRWGTFGQRNFGGDSQEKFLGWDGQEKQRKTVWKKVLKVNLLLLLLRKNIVKVLVLQGFSGKWGC